METHRTLLVFGAVLCLAVFVDGLEFVREPKNTAALTGDSARMECKGEEGTNTIVWQRRSSADGEDDYIYQHQGTSDPRIVAGQEQFYEFDANKLDDLIIKSAGQGTSGFYTCALFRNAEQPKMKVAFNSMDSPLCTSPKENYQELAEPDLECSVTYWGAMKPRLTWIVDNTETLGTVVEDSDTSDTPPAPGEQRILKVTFQNFTVNAAQHDKKPIGCRVTFNDADQITSTGVEGAMPAYTDECNITFGVSYAVRNIKFTPNPDDVPDGQELTVAVGESIKCEAEGSPKITYQWDKELEDSNGPTSVTGEELKVTANMLGKNIYTCIARNNPSGTGTAQVETSKSITFIVTADSGAQHLQHALWFLVAMLMTSLIFHP